MLSKLYRQYLIEQAKQLYNNLPWYEKDDDATPDLENATNDQLKELIMQLIKRGV